MKSRFFHLFILFVFLTGTLVSVPSTPVRAGVPLVVTNTNNSGAGSLRDTIAAAVDGDQIVFHAAVTGTITLSSTLNIYHNITITGPGSGTLAISGADMCRIFYIEDGLNVSISGLTLTHGNVIDSYGGAIFNGTGTLTLDQVVISNNRAQRTTGVGSGGGIFNNGALIITNSTLADNTANNLGGALFNNFDASLQMSNVIVDNNHIISDSGGGLAIRGPSSAAMPGMVTLDRVSITNNTAAEGGGGLWSDDSITITNSLIANNSASHTGGLAIFDLAAPAYPGEINITNTTVSGNTSVNEGSGLRFSLSQASSAAALNNLTIANNQITGASNGGGIRISGSGVIYVKNTIIAGNTLNGSTPDDCNGTINSLDYNLIQTTTNCTINGTIAHNLYGVDPQLAALADNGGPTQTLALLAGSPAIDAGNPGTPGSGGDTCESFDQRGVNRPQGTYCDMGAFEYYLDTSAPTVTSFIVPASSSSLTFPITSFSATDDHGVTGYLITTSSIAPASGGLGWTGMAPGTYTVSSSGLYTLYPWAMDAAGNVSAVYDSPVLVTVHTGTTLVVTNTDDSGPGSLRDTIGAAVNGDQITFDPAVTGTITLLSEIAIYQNIIITGPGSGTLAISGANLVRVFDITEDVNVSMSGLTITHGYVNNNYGGAIYIEIGTLTLDQVVISHSQANGEFGSGGGIYNDGLLIISNSTLAYNTANDMGGALFNNFDKSLQMTNVIVDSNHAVTDSGGGLVIRGPAGSAMLGSVTLDRVSITNNSATAENSEGGGIWSGASITITNSLIANNSATYMGGLLITDELAPTPLAGVNITNTTISGNTATDGAGGIVISFYQGSAATLNNVTIANNQSVYGTMGGAGIAIGYTGTTYVKNSIFAGNTHYGAIPDDCHGPINSLDYNLIQATSGCTITGTTTHNITGVSAQLAALADNGGPTQTMALLVGSPAIDAGNPGTPGSGGDTCDSLDQRGISRPQGSNCDIGAYEAQLHGIPLVVGWNLVSFRLQPLSTAILDVLSSVYGSYDLVYAWDATGGHASAGNWMRYAPGIPGNTLETLDETQGFWIRMIAPGNLTITGTAPTTTIISLSTNASGWNLVGYPSSGTLGMPEALISHGISDYSLVYGYHANDADTWKRYAPGVPGNDLLDLTTDWGYWIKVGTAGTWHVEY